MSPNHLVLSHSAAVTSSASPVVLVASLSVISSPDAGFSRNYEWMNHSNLFFFFFPGYHHQSGQHRTLLQSDPVLLGLQAAASQRPAFGPHAQARPHPRRSFLWQGKSGFRFVGLIPATIFVVASFSPYMDALSRESFGRSGWAFTFGQALLARRSKPQQQSHQRSA